MNPLHGRYGWALGLTLLVLTVAAVAISYNAGVSHGLAQAATAAGTTTLPPGAYRWHGPWGFFPFFPLLFIFFWVFLFRAVWWGRGPRGPYGYGPSEHDRFDEWHRRAHDQMKG